MAGGECDGPLLSSFFLARNRRGKERPFCRANETDRRRNKVARRHKEKPPDGAKVSAVGRTKCLGFGKIMTDRKRVERSDSDGSDRRGSDRREPDQRMLPRRSLMSYSPGGTVVSHAAALRAPAAKILRLRAECERVMISSSPANMTSCSPTIVPPRTA